MKPQFFRTWVFIFALVITLLISSCSNTEIETESDTKGLKIAELCGYVDGVTVSDLYTVRKIISQLVHEDSGYFPLLEEISAFFSVLRERNTVGPKKYPDLMLLISFCEAQKK